MRLVYVVMAALALTPPVALAQRGGAKSAQALTKEGERLYQAGKYKESAEVLKKAYEANPSNTLLLYNIGKALEYARDLRGAVSYYQQYVRSPQESTDPQVLKRATRDIERLGGLIEQEDQTSAAAQAERQKLQEEAEAQRRRVEEEQAAARRAEEESRRQQQAAYNEALKSYKRQKVTAFVVGGVGLAGVGAGVLFGLQARSSRDKFDAAKTVEDKKTFSDDTKSQSLLADIGFGVGVAGALAAIILYPKDGPPAEGEVRMTLAPRGVGAGMEVSF